MVEKAPLVVVVIAVCILLASLVGYTTPKVNYSSQQVFCLEAACVSGTGFDQQCLESKPRLAQMHVTEESGKQRVVFEMTNKPCKESDDGLYRDRKPNP